MPHSSHSSQKKLIQLREGLFYDSIKDSYVIETKEIENLGIISVGLQVTKNCNAHCIHCAASSICSSDLSTASLVKLIKKIHAEGCVRISFTGGEPTLRADLPVLLKTAHDLGMATTLSTNGLLLTREKIQQLKPYLTNIRFSLHGLEATNDRIFAMKGAYKRIIESIKLALDEQLSAGVIFSAMRSNIHELGDLAKYLQSIGLNKLIIFTLMSAGRAEALFAQEFVHVAELEKMIQQINQQKKQENWQMDITLVDWRLEGQCLLIDPMGIIYGYDLNQSDHYLKLGNVFEENLQSLWQKYPHKDNYYKYYLKH